jgi:hypothetical protein
VAEDRAEGLLAEQASARSAGWSQGEPRQWPLRQNRRPPGRLSEDALSFPRMGNRRSLIPRRSLERPLRGPPRRVVTALPLLGLIKRTDIERVNMLNY